MYSSGSLHPFAGLGPVIQFPEEPASQAYQVNSDLPMPKRLPTEGQIKLDLMDAAPVMLEENGLTGGSMFRKTTYR